MSANAATSDGAQILRSSLAEALALASVIGISATFASSFLYVLVAACMLPGVAIGWVARSSMLRIADWYFPGGASFVAQIVGFCMFAITANIIFVIGLSMFLFGAAVCGAGVGILLQLALAKSLAR